jgi:hypothetical protein
VRHGNLEAQGSEARFTSFETPRRSPPTFHAGQRTRRFCSDVHRRRLSGSASPFPAIGNRSTFRSRFAFTAVATWASAANGPFCLESLPYPLDARYPRGPARRRVRRAGGGLVDGDGYGCMARQPYLDVWPSGGDEWSVQPPPFLGERLRRGSTESRHTARPPAPPSSCREVYESPDEGTFDTTPPNCFGVVGPKRNATVGSECQRDSFPTDTSVRGRADQ